MRICQDRTESRDKCADEVWAADFPTPRFRCPFKKRNPNSTMIRGSSVKACKKNLGYYIVFMIRAISAVAVMCDTLGLCHVAECRVQMRTCLITTVCLSFFLTALNVDPCPPDPSFFMMVKPSIFVGRARIFPSVFSSKMQTQIQTYRSANGLRIGRDSQISVLGGLSRFSPCIFGIQ